MKTRQIVPVEFPSPGVRAAAAGNSDGSLTIYTNSCLSEQDQSEAVEELTQYARRELENRLTELARGSTPKYLAMLAILSALADEPTPPKGFSRGDCKRAIRVIRATQRSIEKEDAEGAQDMENAVMLIRRDWLHRKETTA